jgi:hypothetical protein
MTLQVLAKDAYLFEIEPKIRWAPAPSRNHSSSLNFDGKSEPAGIPINYYLKAKPQADVRIAIYKGNMPVSEIKGSANPGLNSVLWDMTQRRELTADEKKAMQERAARFGGTRGGQFAGGMRGQAQRDPNFAYSQADEGEYKVVLTVDGQQFSGFAKILQDVWSLK